jgi:predicted nucleic acid-binding protein
MRKIIIADTSCLIVLDKIGELDILNKLFVNVYVTKPIIKEFGKKLPNWIIVEEPKTESHQKILETSLDKGEASVIALALESPGSLLIIDEIKGRKIAQALGITITGTLGVLILAKKENIIPNIKPILERKKATNFRVDPKLEESILIRCNE